MEGAKKQALGNMHSGYLGCCGNLHGLDPAS